MIDISGLLGIGVTVGLAIVAAVLWVGRLQQRAAVLEDRDKEKDVRMHILEERAVASEKASALSEQRLNGAIIDVNIARADIATDRATLGEIRVAHTEHRGEVRALVSAFERLEDTFKRENRTTRQLLTAALSGRAPSPESGDTPPIGFPRMQRET